MTITYAQAAQMAQKSRENLARATGNYTQVTNTNLPSSVRSRMVSYNVNPTSTYRASTLTYSQAAQMAEESRRKLEAAKKQQQIAYRNRTQPTMTSRTGQPLSQTLSQTPYASMLAKSNQGYQSKTPTNYTQTSVTGRQITDRQAQTQSPYLQKAQYGGQVDYTSPITKQRVYRSEYDRAATKVADRIKNDPNASKEKKALAADVLELDRAIRRGEKAGVSQMLENGVISGFFVDALQKLKADLTGYGQNYASKQRRYYHSDADMNTLQAEYDALKKKQQIVNPGTDVENTIMGFLGNMIYRTEFVATEVTKNIPVLGEALLAIPQTLKDFQDRNIDIVEWDAKTNKPVLNRNKIKQAIERQTSLKEGVKDATIDYYKNFANNVTESFLGKAVDFILSGIGAGAMMIPGVRRGVNAFANSQFANFVKKAGQTQLGRAINGLLEMGGKDGIAGEQTEEEVQYGIEHLADQLINEENLQWKWMSPEERKASLIQIGLMELIPVGIGAAQRQYYIGETKRDLVDAGYSKKEASKLAPTMVDVAIKAQEEQERVREEFEDFKKNEAKQLYPDATEETLWNVFTARKQAEAQRQQQQANAQAQTLPQQELQPQQTTEQPQLQQPKVQPANQTQQIETNTAQNVPTPAQVDNQSAQVKQAEIKANNQEVEPEPVKKALEGLSDSAHTVYDDTVKELDSIFKPETQEQKIQNETNAVLLTRMAETQAQALNRNPELAKKIYGKEKVTAEDVKNQVFKIEYGEKAAKSNAQNQVFDQGYSGRSMSNNAVRAYSEGKQPLSKWTKSAILEAVEEYDDDNDTRKADLVRTLTLKEMRDNLLRWTEWHHTGALYNVTDFYELNEKELERLDKDEIDSIKRTSSKIKEKKALEKELDEAESESRKLNEIPKDWDKYDIVATDIKAGDPTYPYYKVNYKNQDYWVSNRALDDAGVVYGSRLKKALAKDDGSIVNPTRVQVNEFIEKVKNKEIEPVPVDNKDYYKYTKVSKQQAKDMAVAMTEDLLKQSFYDPLGDNVWFYPAYGQSVEDYAMHLISGKDKGVENIDTHRLLGLSLVKQTIENPAAIIIQPKTEGHGEGKAYLGLYKIKDGQMVNDVIVSVSKEQDGRVVTSFTAHDKHRSKTDSITKIVNTINKAKKTLYLNGVLSGHSRSPTNQRKSTTNADLVTPGTDVSIPQSTENVKVFDQAIANQIKGQAIIKQNEAVIKLLDKADASTLMHEAAHVYLQQLYTLASFEGVDEQTKKDFNTLARWLDYDPKQGKLTTKQQEKFARGFEAYLRTGQTQVKNLKGVFNRFKQWLSDIYKTFKELGGKPSKEVRDVMERMVATDAEIKQAKEEAAVAKANERKTTQYWEKAIKKAYPKVSKEFREKMADTLVKMQSSMDGKTNAAVFNQEGQEVVNSNQWYQDWFEKEKRKPNLGEQIKIAYDMLTKNAYGGEEYSKEVQDTIKKWRDRGGSIIEHEDGSMEWIPRGQLESVVDKDEYLDAVAKQGEEAAREKVVKVEKTKAPVKSNSGKYKVGSIEARMKGVYDKVNTLTEQEKRDLNLHEYQQADNKEQMKRAAEFVDKDPDAAFAILMGEKKLPDNLLYSSLSNAYIQWAQLEGEVEKLQEAIVVSNALATRFGQEIQALSNLDPTSAASVIDRIYKIKTKAVSEISGEKYGEMVSKEKQKIEREAKRAIKEQQKTETKGTWQNFIDSIKCPA